MAAASAFPGVCFFKFFLAAPNHCADHWRNQHRRFRRKLILVNVRTQLAQHSLQHLLAVLRIENQQDAILALKINDAVMHERRRYVRCAFADAPGFMFAAGLDKASGTGLQRDDNAALVDRNEARPAAECLPVEADELGAAKGSGPA